MDYTPRLLCPWDSPGKSTGVVLLHALLQRIFLTKGLNPCLLHLLQWQASSLLAPPGEALLEPQRTVANIKQNNKYKSNIWSENHNSYNYYEDDCYYPQLQPISTASSLSHSTLQRSLILYMDSPYLCHLLEQTEPFLWPLSIINKLPPIFPRMVYVTAEETENIFTVIV